MTRNMGVLQDAQGYVPMLGKVHLVHRQCLHMPMDVLPNRVVWLYGILGILPP